MCKIQFGMKRLTDRKFHYHLLGLELCGKLTKCPFVLFGGYADKELVAKVSCYLPFYLLYHICIRRIISLCIKHFYQFCRRLVHTYEQPTSSMDTFGTFNDKIAFQVFHLVYYFCPPA